MLGKLLKYDLKSVGKYWWILVIAMLSLFGVGGTSFGLVQLIGNHMYDEIVLHNHLLSLTMGLASAFLSLTFILSLVGIGICGFGVSVLIYVRYFKHLFTDEGYLTFTLPASRGQIFNAKVLNAAIWCFLTSIVVSVGTFVMMMLIFIIPFDYEYDVEVIKILAKFISSIPFTQWLWFGVWAVIGAFITVASFFLSPCAAYFCITLGATVFKKAKVFGAIGVYVLMYMAVETVTQISAYGVMFFMALSSMGIVDILSKATDLGLNALITSILLIILGITATLAAFFYSITRNILERKLNLA